jgi:hypothetical protein
MFIFRLKQSQFLRALRIQWVALRLLMPTVLLCGSFFLIALDNGTLAHAGQVYTDTMPPKPFNHHVWQEVLSRFVGQYGEVNFRELRIIPKRLNEYLDQLAQVSPERTPDYFPTLQDQLAYWVNSYNALALRLILDVYPVTTWNNVPSTNTRYPIGGILYTLKGIEAKVRSLDPSGNCTLMLTRYTHGTPPVSKTACEGQSVLKLAQQARQRTVLLARYHAQHETVRSSSTPSANYCTTTTIPETPGSMANNSLFTPDSLPYRGRIKRCKQSPAGNSLRQTNTLWSH